MKDKLLFGTIGLLVGIVVMQWTMPSGQATIITQPVGGVVSHQDYHVLMVDGSVWYLDQGVAPQVPPYWRKLDDLPIPVDQVQFFSAAGIVDKNGDLLASLDQGWHNYGHPPVSPVAVEQSTWGKIKSQFSTKGDRR